MTEGTRASPWSELAIAILMGLTTLASGWSAYQSALWEGIQTFRLADLGGMGRDVSVKEVALGQEHVLQLFLLERFLDAREESDNRRAAFFLGRLPPELQIATKAWLQSRPGENAAAAPSPFQVPEYVEPRHEALEALRRKRAATYAEADQANKISDNYVRLTVFFGLVLFLLGITAVMKGEWARRVLLAAGAMTFLVSLGLLAQMPLAAE